MVFNVKQEIQAFRAHFRNLARSRSWNVEKLAADAFLLSPKRPLRAKGRSIGLTFMGLTHGDEICGLSVLNEMLVAITEEFLSPRTPVAFILGNTDAALEGKRFLEYDLNRSFAPSPAISSTLEGHRAKALSPILTETAFLLDFHQVSAPSDRAFFIFPYLKSAFSLARAIDPRISIITHWGDAFSTEGLCTDEFVNDKGGIGLTLELGQRGVSPYQVGVGYLAGCRMLSLATAKIGSRKLKQTAREPTGDIFTWHKTVPYPKEHVDLKPGWRNFADIQEGDEIGRYNGQPIYAPVSGTVLFPKYLSKEEHQTLARPPEELIRIMKTITTKDLP